ncbi:MAG: tRNA preQ1(34) S-adenosylmethionine ribosyltransferase-isomerase QueA [Coriobacteriia bacterium]|nr:tRNA preQ1(34) S-adenosylmethionine ribosyltransferase-isomerase QueA [Coriobacteriia bacterium]
MRTEDFDYYLPEEQIAQEPMMPRDACKMLVMKRREDKLEHRHFYDILEYFEPGDLLVVNDTRVLPARLQGKRADTGGAVEVLLLKELDKESNTWECLAKPAKRLRTGAKIEFTDPNGPTLPLLKGSVVGEDEEGIRHISFEAANDDFHAAIHKLGTLPLPPYIRDYAGDQDMYQTVYAGQDEHSAAAPTAGLHFTPELLQKLQDKGVGITRVRLDVGLDTFRPVSEDDPTQHHIHTEYFHVSQEAADAVNAAHAAGKKVVAVGTTVVRALESAAKLTASATISEQGAPTSLYILPGFEFQVVDALITNFHVPKSTLVMMISAFAGREKGREKILAAYAEAVSKNYRFLSFGDAMLIL